MAIILLPDGTRTVVEPENGRFFTLTEKRRLVPGCNTVTFLDDCWSLLWCSGERSRGEAYNEAVTTLLTMCRGRRVPMAYGAALLFRNKDFESGKTAEEDAAEAESTLEMVRFLNIRRPVPVIADNGIFDVS